MNRKQNFKVTAGLLLVAIIWGSGFIATQIAIDEGLSPSFIMFVRFAVASIVIFIASRKELGAMTYIDIKMGSIAGVLLFLGFTLQTMGLRFTTPSANAFLTATSVVLVPFFTWIIFKEKPRNKVFIAALICFTGIGILSLNQGGDIGLGIGEILTLLCAIAFALHTVTMGKFAPKMNSWILTFLQIVVVAILSLVMFLVLDRDFKSFLSFKGLLAVVYLGVFSTFISYSIQTVCQKFASPSKVSIIISTEALFGTLFSIMLGFESFTYSLMFGGVAIIISMLIIELNVKFEK